MFMPKVNSLGKYSWDEETAFVLLIMADSIHLPMPMNVANEIENFSRFVIKHHLQ